MIKTKVAQEAVSMKDVVTKEGMEAETDVPVVEKEGVVEAAENVEAEPSVVERGRNHCTKT